MAIDHNAKAHRLLETVHDLAGGGPQTAVLSARVSARTGIPNNYRVFTVEAPQSPRPDPDHGNDRDRHRRDVPDNPDRSSAGRCAKGYRLSTTS